MIIAFISLQVLFTIFYMNYTPFNPLELIGLSTPIATRHNRSYNVGNLTFQDDYLWLKSGSKEVFDYVEEENRYSDRFMKPFKALQEDIIAQLDKDSEQTLFTEDCFPFDKSTGNLARADNQIHFGRTTLTYTGNLIWEIIRYTCECWARYRKIVDAYIARVRIKFCWT